MDGVVYPTREPLVRIMLSLFFYYFVNLFLESIYITNNKFLTNIKNESFIGADQGHGILVEFVRFRDFKNEQSKTL